MPQDIVPLIVLLNLSTGDRFFRSQTANHPKIGIGIWYKKGGAI